MIIFIFYGDSRRIQDGDHIFNTADYEGIKTNMAFYSVKNQYTGVKQ
jgi:hypothetical protein